MFKDGQRDNVASLLRQATHNTQMEATHLGPLSLRDFFFELKKVEQVPWEPRKPMAGFPESLGSGEGQFCAKPAPQVRLVSTEKSLCWKSSICHENLEKPCPWESRRWDHTHPSPPQGVVQY